MKVKESDSVLLLFNYITPYIEAFNQMFYRESLYRNGNARLFEGECRREIHYSSKVILKKKKPLF